MNLFFLFSCSIRECRHRLRVICSANNEEVSVEVATLGHEKSAHEPKTTLTKPIKEEMEKFFEFGLKPKAIRLRLLVTKFCSREIIIMFRPSMKLVWFRV
jgi:hypothetical protein